MEKIRLRANAKINLALAITGKLDNGYHSIDTLMQTVSLYDSVIISKANEISVVCDCLIPQEDNIVFKAARLFFEHTKISGRAKIELQKNIPMAAGLGGGSADAAAVLVGSNELYETNLSESCLCELALSLGADVPFFVSGGTQRAQGIGEKLTTISNHLNCAFVIVKEGSKFSTKEMYDRLDNAEYQNPSVDNVVKAIEKNNIKMLCENIGNCFSAIYKNDDIIDEISLTKPLGICLSGSGPSLFAVYENVVDANNSAKLLKEKGINAFAVVPTAKGIEIE